MTHEMPFPTLLTLLTCLTFLTLHTLRSPIMPHTMRVLIVEDDAKTAGYLRKGLTEEGFIVDVAPTGGDGLFHARSGPFDVVVLDIMLPGLDGWEMLTKLRREGFSTPVLILSARDAVTDRVKGLELGADDYLIKPFAFSELVARLRTVLRRAPARRADLIQVADLEIDMMAHKVSRAGQKLELTPKEFALLSLLARRPGQALSRTVIAEQVWDMNFDSDTNVVDVHIRRLRAKVDDPYERKLIRTVRGVGYALDETA
jgi:two-component system, OmpR family, copper resistance phosphate regulon response regulator CusR